MNLLTITGRLTRNAEQRFTADGKAVVSFSVANNTGYGDKQKTHYFDCALWGKRAEGTLKDYLIKGQQVTLSGEVSLNSYQKKDGTTGASINVRVGELDLMGKPDNQQPAQQTNNAGQSYQEAPQQQNNAPEMPEDSIPF